MNKKPVMVTTESKGVFFGYLEGEEGENITLTNVRCCIFWSSAMRGVLGLVVYGPDGDCRIGPAAPRGYIRGVTAIFDLHEEAVTRWESAPWAD